MPVPAFYPLPRRLVAIGDLQGNLPGLEQILRGTGLVDRAGQWAGADSGLVQMGDVFGRGADPKGVYDRLRDLTPQAAAAGGFVCCLLGNHEAEVVHRYEFECDPKEYLRFATPATLKKWKHERAEAEESFWSLGEEESLPLANLVGAWELLHPIGREEFRAALAPTGEWGRFICELPAVVKVGPVLFSHAGMLPPYAKMGIEATNLLVHESMVTLDYFPALPDGDVLLDPEGPLWTRALAWGRAGIKKSLSEVARRLGTSVQVVGHTPTDDLRIRPRYGGRAYCIDTSIGRAKGGRLSALLVEEGSLWAVYPPQARRRLGSVPPVPPPLVDAAPSGS